MPDFDDQYVLFLDLLGFDEAVRNASPPQLADLKRLMEFIASARRPYDLKISATETSIETNCTPQITTFSDLVLVSLPLIPDCSGVAEEFRQPLMDTWPSGAIEHLADIVARVVVESLKLRLLVRGGLTVGSLHHTDKVVLGVGLNEAYDIEHKQAKHPRVMVAPEVFDKMPELKGHDLLLQDSDGQFHLDYLQRLVMRLQAERPGDDHSSWREARLQDIDSVIRSKMNDAGVCMKWVWFQQYFKDGTAVLAQTQQGGSLKSERGDEASR